MVFLQVDIGWLLVTLRGVVPRASSVVRWVAVAVVDPTDARVAVTCEVTPQPLA